MAWDEKAWIDRVNQATTGQELIDLAMEIPDDLPSIVPDDPVTITMEQQTNFMNSTSNTPTEKTPAG
ncbi:hypothetical protein [Sulfuritalea sp.]|uniref:hypothetical protein n=1 Tax=Sulfuritalea sp. TaxID=2480090 RepID=UPI001AC430B5|nr:hypothetical protein [Sulfuritalea sp.]MBN8476049.1 hypothetical protein [Sulfuritalea sp.]